MATKTGGAGKRSGRKGRLRRAGRIAGGTLAVLIALAGAAFGAEAVAESGDDTRHPMPGRLVDVGGHRLHLHCEGPRAGGPTVLLDAGWGESSSTWAGVRSALAARSVRACAYDRAGYAWSEPGPGPRDAGRAAGELHALLERSGETGPFVLAAHSYGGHVVRLLADRHPERVAGLVLVDVTDASGKSDAAIEASIPLMTGQTRLYGLAARSGLIRLAGDWLLPEDTTAPGREHAPVVYGPGSMTAAEEEAEVFLSSTRQVHATERPGAWGDMPVVVIAARAGGPPGIYEALAKLSTRGRYVLADTDRHYVHLARQDLVVDGILDVASAARAGTR
ncbi:alpha/beta fold hydrolase [Planomonospora sp. ID67723]|uniref:alpha/beta hydrolase n=1 Tax=Planomonospora sp. ID67723 TaxID=2738134 RepID=UPI0018C3B0E2|nr:alpha/beta hydrolase [Planomonospora sp. ID67723]MBG0830339.1 alpha/beta fold hydrolase [Planomonospora sp. ID67723]